MRGRATFGGFAVVIAATAAMHACAARTARTDVAMVPAVRVSSGGSVIAVPLEEYVRVAILSEFAPLRADVEAAGRMLEVQAIVSRTYAVGPRHTAEGFDFCSTTHCQLYEPDRVSASRWSGAASDAIRKTTGVIVRFGGAPAKIVFHADCGGHTSAARDVWSEGLSYLAAVSDNGPADGAHADWRFAPAEPALLAALNADTRTSVGNRLNRIDVLRRDDAGRALLVGLDGELAPVVRGEELRAVLTRAFGARAFRSTRFHVTRTGRGFEFTGRGFGHGVGLCQAGAFARVAAGATPAEVIAHYFPGTSLR